MNWRLSTEEQSELIMKAPLPDGAPRPDSPALRQHLLPFLKWAAIYVEFARDTDDDGGGERRARWTSTAGKDACGSSSRVDNEQIVEASLVTRQFSHHQGVKIDSALTSDMVWTIGAVIHKWTPNRRGEHCTHGVYNGLCWTDRAMDEFVRGYRTGHTQSELNTEHQRTPQRPADANADGHAPAADSSFLLHFPVSSEPATNGRKARRCSRQGCKRLTSWCCDTCLNRNGNRAAFCIGTNREESCYRRVHRRLAGLPEIEPKGDAPPTFSGDNAPASGSAPPTPSSATASASSSSSLHSYLRHFPIASEPSTANGRKSRRCSRAGCPRLTSFCCDTCLNQRGNPKAFCVGSNLETSCFRREHRRLAGLSESESRDSVGGSSVFYDAKRAATSSPRARRASPPSMLSPRTRYGHAAGGTAGSIEPPHGLFDSIVLSHSSSSLSSSSSSSAPAAAVLHAHGMKRTYDPPPNLKLPNAFSAQSDVTHHRDKRPKKNSPAALDLSERSPRASAAPSSVNEREKSPPHEHNRHSRGGNCGSVSSNNMSDTDSSSDDQQAQRKVFPGSSNMPRTTSKEHNVTMETQKPQPRAAQDGAHSSPRNIPCPRRSSIASHRTCRKESSSDGHSRPSIAMPTTPAAMMVAIPLAESVASLAMPPALSPSAGATAICRLSDPAAAQLDRECSSQSDCGRSTCSSSAMSDVFARLPSQSDRMPPNSPVGFQHSDRYRDSDSPSSSSQTPCSSSSSAHGARLPRLHSGGGGDGGGGGGCGSGYATAAAAAATFPPPELSLSAAQANFEQNPFFRELVLQLSNTCVSSNALSSAPSINPSSLQALSGQLCSSSAPHFHQKPEPYALPSNGNDEAADASQSQSKREEAPKEEAGVGAFRVSFSVASNGHTVCERCRHEFSRTDDLRLHVKFHENDESRNSDARPDS